MNTGQRIKVLSEEHNLRVGTIGTLLSHNDKMCIIRYKFENERENLAAIHEGSIVEATNYEVNSVFYKHLVTKKYHVGKRLILERNMDKFNKGEVFYIYDVTLNVNENDDIFVLKNEKYGEIIKLNKVNLDSSFEEYNEEFEESLGKEIDIKSKEKNYHLVNARMQTTDGKIVIIKTIEIEKDDKNYVCIDSKGNIFHYKKDDLIPFESHSDVARNNLEDVIPSKFKEKEKLIANEEISKHALLNINFNPGDIIEMGTPNTISVNYMDDTYNVSKNRVNFILSAFELENFFEPYYGMVKQINDGKIISVSSDKEIKEEITKIKEEKKFDIRISSVEINNHYFTIDRMGYIQSDLYTNNIDEYIEVLKELKKVLDN